MKRRRQRGLALVLVTWIFMILGVLAPMALVLTLVAVVKVLLPLLLAGWPPVTDILARWAPTWLVETVAAFSFMPHFDSIQRGVLDLRDLIYYVSVITFMLFAAHLVIDNRKSA